MRSATGFLFVAFHRLRVLGDEILGDCFDLWSVESRFVVSVPAFDGTSREPMLESAPDVLHIAEAISADERSTRNERKKSAL